MADCPSDEQLSGLVTGTLPPEQIEQLAAHLEVCPACEARVSALDQLSDPLMSGLRARAGHATTAASPAGGQVVELRTGQVLGDYVLGDELGSGGMGRVFRATHVRMRREVALKVVSRRGMRSRDAARRFAREVELAGKLIHPNIAIAHDAREQDGIVYLIMEYVEGTDLARLVKQKGPLPIEAAVDYVTQAALGLAYAHERGIVHRDVKPANLMLDAYGVVKVLDMGLSRLREGAELGSSTLAGVEAAPAGPAAAATPDGSQAGREVTLAGDVLGTVDFVAPEQAQSPRDADHRADVYGLGCTLFYLLTGRSAFARGSTAATLQAHRSDPPPSLRKARPGSSTRLEKLFGRMVAKRPDDRFETMNDVVKELRACQRPARSTWRRPVAAVTACVMLVAAAGWAWQWQHGRPISAASNPTTARTAAAPPPVPVLPFEPQAAVRHRDAWRAYANVPEEMTNSIGMKFAFIPPGEYRESDQLKVRITRPYYMGVYEVTVGQFRQFARQAKYKTVAERLGGILDGPAGFELRTGVNWETSAFALSDEHPALQLAYVDLLALARWLSHQEGRTYALPTAAQWVWAAQAGTPAPLLWNDAEDAAAYGWNRSNSGHVPHAVGLLKPNPWGLYDVRGNAAEWCADFVGSPPWAAPLTGVVDDPAGPSVGQMRVLLGSTFTNDDNYAVPGTAGPEMRYPTWGGRLVCEIDAAPSIAARAPAPASAAATSVPTNSH